jgi:hypothetical protein
MSSALASERTDPLQLLRTVVDAAAAITAAIAALKLTLGMRFRVGPRCVNRG